MPPRSIACFRRPWLPAPPRPAKPAGPDRLGLVRRRSNGWERGFPFFAASGRLRRPAAIPAPGRTNGLGRSQQSQQDDFLGRLAQQAGKRRIVEPLDVGERERALGSDRQSGGQSLVAHGQAVENVLFGSTGRSGQDSAQRGQARGPSPQRLRLFEHPRLHPALDVGKNLWMRVVQMDQPQRDFALELSRQQRQHVGRPIARQMRQHHGHGLRMFTLQIARQRVARRVGQKPERPVGPGRG